MAQTTVYTCDICKQSKDKGDLAKIEVRTEGIRIKDCDRYNQMKIDICKECLREKGFEVDGSCEEVAEKNKKTLEDKFLEILEDLGVEFVE